MKKATFLLPLAAAAALVGPGLAGRSAEAVTPPDPVAPSDVIAAVAKAEAQRKAAAAPRALAAKDVAEMDKMAGAAAHIDPQAIDPNIAINALSH